jgi:hypothetical protein
MGQLPKRDFYMFSNQEKSARVMSIAFQELGLPYSCTTHASIQDIGSISASPSFGGAGVENIQGLEVRSLGEGLEWNGRFGNVDTIHVHTDVVGTRSLIGHSVKSGMDTSLLEVIVSNFQYGPADVPLDQL